MRFLAIQRDPFDLCADGRIQRRRPCQCGPQLLDLRPDVQVSCNNAKNGFNAAIFTGVTLNTENHDADYQSGSAFHIDASVQQLLPLGPGFVSVGFNAFYYNQFDGNSGSGAKLGDFKGRDIGIGPALGYILPVGENTLVAEARWLPELDTKRRLEGAGFRGRVQRRRQQNTLSNAAKESIVVPV